MSPLLAVRNLSTSFVTDHGEARAVDGVSFSLEAGETLGLVGESGCGKTVTALSILRLIPQPPGRFGSESRIEFRDVDLLRLPVKELRSVRGAEISMIFQEPMSSLNPVLTVGSQIAETLRAHQSISRSSARLRSIELLDLVGIADPGQRVDDYPHQLSGGMRQRVMIAMALACQPQILIADEPTTALDVTVQAQILELLVSLKKQFGMAVIFITHDLGIVAGIADRIAVMYGGRIVEHGPTTKVFEQPAHPYTEGLLQAVPRIDRPLRTLAAIPGTVPTATSWPTGCRFHPRCAQRMERCAGDQPSEFNASSGHYANCWLLTRNDEPGNGER
jgi:peptide/nickel transport system ATP-binding protein/oligopeptide transport system ATP-binding protein